MRKGVTAVALFEEPFSGTEPVYRQLVNRVKRKLAAGELSAGDVLPSRRELAVKLGINPNTVQKAYKILEDEVLVNTVQGSHSVICADEKSINEIRRSLAEEAARTFAIAAKELGFDFRGAVGLLADEWEKKDE